MTPGKYDLSLYRGDSYTWQFVLWQDEDKTIPTDLTDVVAAAQIRAKPGATPIIVLECEVTAPNIVTVQLTPEAWEDSSCIVVGMWDLELTYLDGTVQTVIAGKVRITADVTRLVTT